MKKLLGFLFLAAILAVVSCDKDDEGGEDPVGCVTDGLTYTADTKEI